MAKWKRVKDIAEDISFNPSFEILDGYERIQCAKEFACFNPSFEIPMLEKALMDLVSAYYSFNPSFEIPGFLVFCFWWFLNVSLAACG